MMYWVKKDFFPCLFWIDRSSAWISLVALCCSFPISAVSFSKPLSAKLRSELVCRKRRISATTLKWVSSFSFLSSPRHPEKELWYKHCYEPFTGKDCTGKDVTQISQQPFSQVIFSLTFLCTCNCAVMDAHSKQMNAYLSVSFKLTKCKTQTIQKSRGNPCGGLRIRLCSLFSF